MEMRISEAEERRTENMRRNGEVLASLGFDINEQIEEELLSLVVVLLREEVLSGHCILMKTN